MANESPYDALGSTVDTGRLDEQLAPLYGTENIWSIASQYLGEWRTWRDILDANDIEDALDMLGTVSPAELGLRPATTDISTGETVYPVLADAGWPAPTVINSNLTGRVRLGVWANDSGLHEWSFRDITYTQPTVTEYLYLIAHDDGDTGLVSRSSGANWTAQRAVEAIATLLAARYQRVRQDGEAVRVVAEAQSGGTPYATLTATDPAFGFELFSRPVMDISVAIQYEDDDPDDPDAWGPAFTFSELLFNDGTDEGREIPFVVQTEDGQYFLHCEWTQSTMLSFWALGHMLVWNEATAVRSSILIPGQSLPAGRGEV